MSPERVLVYIEIAVGIQVLFWAAGGVCVGWLMIRMRMEIAEFRQDIINLLDLKLNSYLSTQRFQDHTASHAREHEHLSEDIGELKADIMVLYKAIEKLKYDGEDKE